MKFIKILFFFLSCALITQSCAAKNTVKTMRKELEELKKLILQQTLNTIGSPSNPLAKNTSTPQSKETKNTPEATALIATLTSTSTNNKEESLPEEKISPQELKRTPQFEVKNSTGKTIFITCFYYIKRQEFNRWSWEKSEIFKLQTNETISITLKKATTQNDFENVYGYLGIFDTDSEALIATYELTPDKNKIDLDLLYKLKNKVVELQAEKYGFKEEKIKYEFEDKQKKLALNDKPIPKLDFQVENKTGKSLYIASFIYEKKPDMPVWQYSKGNIVLIQPNETIIIPVTLVKAEYERVYTRGYLGVFGEQEKQDAENSTFETLKPAQKVSLGRLFALNEEQQRIVLSIEKYGVSGDYIDFITKPIRNPLNNRRK